MLVETSNDGRWVRITIENMSFVVSFEAWSYAISHPGKLKMI